MWIVWGLIGICIGSFLGVLGERLPHGEDVIWGRSHCDVCRKTLSWYELIPLLSFAIQRGRCRHCGKALSLRYPAIELATGVLWAVTAYGSPPTLTGLGANLLVGSSLLVIFIADMGYQIIPDSMLVTATIGILGRWAPGRIDIAQAFWAGIGAAAFLLFLWIVTRGAGIGLGDVKLVLVMGLLLGFPGVLFALYIAFLTGAGVGVILIMRRKKSLKSKIAFGPFLLLGTAASIVWKEPLMLLWQRFF